MLKILIHTLDLRMQKVQIRLYQTITIIKLDHIIALYHSTILNRSIQSRESTYRIGLNNSLVNNFRTKTLKDETTECLMKTLETNIKV
jgi:hypothetical protein